jgi:glutamate--cysteine ligase
MHDWAAELLESMQGICELLDAAHPLKPYSATLREQQGKLADVEQTPSARLLRELRESGESFTALVLRLSQAHRQQIMAAPPRNPSRLQQFESEVEESQRAQRGSFEQYLAAYLAD